MEHVRPTSTLDRVIHVPLSEADWQAFIATTPQPVDWLRDRIKEAIALTSGSDAANTRSATRR
jgi:hypothetical protein